MEPGADAPASTAGVGLNVVGSLAAPEASDPEVVTDEIEGFVSGLLGLVGVAADPLTSREHILLSNILANEWSSGRSLDLAALIGMIQSPPIRKLGVFEVESFFPQKDRTELAMRVNGLLASPARLHLMWTLSQGECDVTHLADRVGGKVVFTAMLFFSALPAYLVARADSYGALLLCAFLVNEAVLLRSLGTSRFLGRALSIYLPTYEMQAQDVLRIGTCPACGHVSRDIVEEINFSSRVVIDRHVRNAPGGTR